MSESREYINFPLHVDNALEKVHGKHINDLQKYVNVNQKDIISIYNETFLDKSLFVLQNNPYINYMFNSDFENEDHILKIKSYDYILNKEESCIEIKPGLEIATIHSVTWQSKYRSVLNDFILKGAECIDMDIVIKQLPRSEILDEI